MSEIQFDVNVAKGVAIDVANHVLPVWWMEVYPFRVNQSESLLPYMRKFSREFNFRYFREWFENAKISLREKLYLKRKFKSWYRHYILLHTLSNLITGRKSRTHLV